MTDTTSAIVVGAGLVGAVLAYSLAEVGLQVTICDRIDITAKPDLSKFERPISLNWFSRSLLHELGLWDELLPGAVPITKVHVSVSNSFGSHMFRAETTPALGYVLSFIQLQTTLWDKILNHPNINFICWSGYESFTQDDSGITIAYKTASDEVGQLSADCCFAVDGTNSYIRENFLDIKTDDSDTLHCLAADVTVNKLDVAAYQRMTREGTLALIPTTTPNTSRLMWSMQESVAADLQQCTPEQLVERANKLLGTQLGCIEACLRHVFLPLPWRIAREAQQQRVLLMGNAAHTIYPAAAQGFNLGLQDIAILLYSLEQQRSDVKAWFAAYLADAKKLQHKRISFVKTQHCFNKYTLTQSIMAKTLGLMDILRPVSNTVAASYMGTDIDAKYLDTVQMMLAARKVADAV